MFRLLLGILLIVFSPIFIFVMFGILIILGTLLLCVMGVILGVIYHWPLLVIPLILGILLIWGIRVSNKLNRSIVKIDEASSGIDVALTKRYDILKKMIETVKGYAKHEKDTIFETISLRKGITIQEKNDINQKMEANLARINLLVENYPNLKASEHFKVLQQSIADIEEHLQASRRLYNAKVSAFNQKIVSFPSSLVANIKGLTKKDFFEVDDTRKQDVNVSFL